MSIETDERLASPGDGLEDDLWTQDDHTLGSSAADPTRIGRFAILRRIGAGGMGVVYSAYDEELDRRVAIKLLHVDEGIGSLGRARLQREAQALARLSHPHVVAVYEVGLQDDRVYLVMEFIRGVTARAWALTEKRSWREVVEIYVQAGRGLAAAHAAALVHRDFKPDNVLVGDDGRVRVVDFGLALPDVGEGEGEEHGAPMGTPAYMAPEVFARDPIDARSDQFSFAVTLWEALFAERPYPGRNRIEIGMAVLAGELRTPPRADVPSRIRRTLARALAPDPAARFADMDDLLDELAHQPVRTRRLAIAGGAVALVAAAYGIGTLRERPCSEVARALDGTWDETRRDAIGAAFASSGAAEADESLARVTARIDAWAQSWIRARTDACEATEVRGEQSSHLLDLRMACLDHRRRELAAVVDVLDDADQGAVRRAPTAVAKLPALDRCADAEALLASVAPPTDPTTAAAVEAMRERIAEAGANDRFGRPADSIAAVEAALADVDAIDYPPLRAEVLAQLGHSLASAGRYADAEPKLVEAWFTALEVGHDEVAFEVALALVYAIGDAQLRPREGHEWARGAAAMMRRARLGGGAREAWLESNIGSVLLREAKHEQARPHYERAIEIAETIDPPDLPSLASFHSNLGNVFLAASDFDGARAHYERALALREESLGPSHPDIARVIVNLAGTMQQSGEPAAARGVFERGLALVDLHGDRIDPQTRAALLANFALALDDLGDRDAALAHTQRALDVYRELYGPEHPNVGFMQLNLGGFFHDVGRNDEALVALREAVRLTASLGNHPDVAKARGALAGALTQVGDLDGALEHYDAAVTIMDALGLGDDPDVVLHLSGAAQIHLDRDAIGSARPVLDRALTIVERHALGGVTAAEPKFVLARVLWAEGKDLARARALAREALANLNEEAAPQRDRVAEIAAWVDARRE